MSWCLTYPDALPLTGGCVVAIGNFDGVHAGHRHLLALARADADARGLPLVVLTFEPHPRSVLRPDVPLMRLTTLDEKVGLLAAVAVDGVAVVAFSVEVAGWSPQRFVDDVLLDWLQARCVCVGMNFRFGHKAQGDIATLREAGLDVIAAELHADELGVVSSSRLRAAR